MSGSYTPYSQHPHSQQSQPVQHPIYEGFQQPGPPAPQSFPYGAPHHHAQPGGAPAVFPPQFNPHLPQHVADPSAPFDDPQQLPNAGVTHWVDQEADASPIEPKAGGKGRRKPSSSEQVKHRRTRSGCYTCRQRRVKCDEALPICERCRKGQRECVYPDPNAKNKSAAGTKACARHKPSMESLSEEEEGEDEEDHDSFKAPSPDAQDVNTARKSRPGAQSARAAAPKPGRSTLSLSRIGSSSFEQRMESSLSPSTEDSHNLSSALNSGKLSNVSTNTSHDEGPSSPAPKDHQFYLDYHVKNITFHHYQFKFDSFDFIHTALLDQASRYDPLLYAIIGFAAFQYTVNNPKGKISDFLGYYTRAVSLFRKSLQGSQEHTLAMLLTVLTLATFEEYLGDWVNLFGHQRAACEMLTELYDPISVTNDEISRTVFVWYTRFDLFVGMMAGNEPMLPPEWFRYNAQWYAQVVLENPGSYQLQIESYFAHHRLIAVEIAVLNAKLPKGEIPVDDYVREIGQLRERVKEAKPIIDNLRQLREYQVLNTDEMRPHAPGDAGEPYVPGRLMKGELWPVNTMAIDWAAIDAMTVYQSSIVLQQAPMAVDLMHFALEQIRILQDIDRWSGSPAGSIIPLQASLGLVCLFLPREDRHVHWCRQQLAKIESYGYIFPASLRSKLAEAWGEPSILRWWLPDEDTCPVVIRKIRAFVEERTMKPSSQLGADIRAMKAMFSKFGLDESASNSPESAANTADHSSASNTGSFQKVGSPSTDSNYEEQTHQQALGPTEAHPGFNSQMGNQTQDPNADWSGQQDPWGGYR